MSRRKSALYATIQVIVMLVAGILLTSIVSFLPGAIGTMLNFVVAHPDWTVMVTVLIVWWILAYHQFRNTKETNYNR